MIQRGKSLIFLHTPKAAGSTLNTIIDRQFLPSVIFKINNSDVQKSINEFKNIVEEKRIKIRCLMGHMPFGLHRYLPQPSIYVTLLRNPIDRVISHYYFVLRNPNHYLYEKVTSNNMSLKDYVSSAISPELTNGQTRLISGVERVDSINGDEFVSADILEIAKKNLQDYFVVGLSEKFDESLILFKRILGWKNIFYIKRNVTDRRPSINEIDEETIKTIIEYNKLDIDLYIFAEQIFENFLKGQGASFNKQVEHFRLLNKYYYPFSPHRMIHKIKKVTNYLLREISYR